MATVLSFVNTLCTRSEPKFPILVENNKNHQITLTTGRFGFPSLDVVDRDEPKYQIRSPYELTNAIISTYERYNDCFLLHSTVPAQSNGEFLQIMYGTDDSILQQPNSIGYCISAGARMSKGFADFLSHRISGQHVAKQDFSWDKFTSFGAQQQSAISTIWCLKKSFAINPTYQCCLKH